MRGVGSKAGDTRGTFRFSNILALTSFCKGFGSNFSDEGHSPTPENTNQSFTPVRLLGLQGGGQRSPPIHLLANYGC